MHFLEGLSERNLEQNLSNIQIDKRKPIYGQAQSGYRKGNTGFLWQVPVLMKCPFSSNCGSL